MEREQLIVEKTDFNRYVQTFTSELDKKYNGVTLKDENVKKREEIVTKREENVKKREQELDTVQKRLSELENKFLMWLKDIDNQSENIKERWATLLKTEEELRINQSIQHSQGS